MSCISIVGAAAVYDWAYTVDALPRFGDIVFIDQPCQKPLFGGCAINMAVGFARLGGFTPRLFYPVGNDFCYPPGQNPFEQQGVDCRQLVHVPDVPSGFAHLYMQPDGTTMCFAYPGASAVARYQQPAQLDDWVIVTPVLGDFCTDLLEQAVQQGKKVVFSGITGPALLSWLPAAAALFLNSHELDLLMQAGGFSGPAQLQAQYPDLLLFVTDGARGSTVWQQGFDTPVPVARPQQVTESTGAGDSFATGTVHALMRGSDPVTAAHFGAVVASFVVEQLGGQTGLPSAAMARDRFAQQFSHLLPRLH